MKGLYITNLNPDKSPGYRSKILGQILGFNKLGINMGLIEKSSNHIQYSYFEKSELVSTEFLNNGKHNQFTFRLILLICSYQQILKHQYDFIYLRYPRSDPFLLLFLLIIKSQFRWIKVLNEIPTFPYGQEYLKNIKIISKITYLIDFLSRSFLCLCVDRIVSIRYPKKIFNVPTISIGNGIQEEQFALSKPIQNLFYNNPSEIHIIGVANLSFCHGYDRIIKGIYEYNQKKPINYKLYFHVVSPENHEVIKLKTLSQNLELQDYIILHGLVEGKKLDDLFDKVHIAVGVLAAHRKNLHQASALKLREYTLRGKLFMNSVLDIDFLDFPYCYTPQYHEEDPINMNEVIAFIEEKSRIKNLNKLIRDYAQINLSWSKQLQPVVTFLNHPK